MIEANLPYACGSQRVVALSRASAASGQLVIGQQQLELANRASILIVGVVVYDDTNSIATNDCVDVAYIRSGDDWQAHGPVFAYFGGRASVLAQSASEEKQAGVLADQLFRHAFSSNVIKRP